MIKLDGLYSVEVKYKGKRYRFWKIKEEQKVRPIGEENDPSQEIAVKDFEVRSWNVTVNINGEETIIGWGPIKHLTIWGSIVLVILITYFIIRYRSVKKEKELIKKIRKHQKNHPPKLVELS